MQNDSKRKVANKLPDALFEMIRELIHRDHLDLEQIVSECIKHGYRKANIQKAHKIIEKHNTPEDQREQHKLLWEEPLIVPPGLNSTIGNFIAHFSLSDKKPILILGDTGVGKSLFFYLAKKLFQKRFENIDFVPPIEKVNCSHFQPNLAKSELFGHVKGAFTGADRERKGFIEKANGGLLILEEIGELPPEVQAMLLVFIETKEYFRLGSDEPREANVKVVGVTNRESALRDDFRFRFSPFYIPPVRERKGDILYYFYAFFPEITKALSPSEVLILLTHNWPGNVREIERIGSVIRREKWLDEQAINGEDSRAQSSSRIKIIHLDPKDTSFNPWILDDLVNTELPSRGVDVVSLDKKLRKYGVSLTTDSNETAFKKQIEREPVFSWFDEYSLKIYDPYRPFENAVDGYEYFCQVFFQDSQQDANILTKISNSNEPESHSDGGHSKPGYEKKFIQLVNALHQKFIGTGLGDHDSPFNDEAIDEVSKLTEEELLRQYHLKILEKTGGNVRAAARRVALNESTLRARLRKLGINPNRN